MPYVLGMRVKPKRVMRIAGAALQELQHAAVEEGANVAETVSAGLHVARVVLSNHINNSPPKTRPQVRATIIRSIQSLMLQVEGDTVPS